MLEMSTAGILWFINSFFHGPEIVMSDKAALCTQYCSVNQHFFQS